MAMAWNEVAGKGVPGLGVYFEGREGGLDGDRIWGWGKEQNQG